MAEYRPVMHMAGWTVTGLVAAFLTFDAVIKIIEIAPVTASFQQLGYPVDLARGIGVLEAMILMLYLVPRTSVLGAVLLTGVLGGAVASHLRIESPLLTHTLFGVYLGAAAWAGLYLRNRKLRELLSPAA